MAKRQDIEQVLHRYFVGHPQRAELGPLLIAVSGGVDSMVLLHAICPIAAQHGFAVAAVHVNHHLRGDARLDEEMVSAFCETLRVPCERRHVDVSQTERTVSKGTEADARMLRYGAIADTARTLGARRVCLAHHADDQVETVLWRLLRGSGLTGLAGIRPSIERAGIVWSRPLLAVDKATLYAYAKRHRVPFREDETNRMKVHVRNAIRLRVIPALRELQPNLSGTVQSLTTILRDEDEWMHAQASRLVHQVSQFGPRLVDVDLNAFRGAPRPLQRRAIQILLYYLGCEQLSFAQVESVLKLTLQNAPSGMFQVSGQVVARRSYDGLRLESGLTDREHAQQPTYAVIWQLDETPDAQVAGHFPGWSWRFERRRWTPEQGVETASLFELRIPYHRFLTIRNGEPGDRMRLMGGGSKKTQDVFVDTKVPRWLRSQWPVVCIDRDIVWIPGVRRAGIEWIAPYQETGWVVSAYPYIHIPAVQMNPRLFIDDFD